jgi:hypothetical protein
MTGFSHQNLSGSRSDEVDLSGSRIDEVDLSGSRFNDTPARRPAFLTHPGGRPELLTQRPVGPNFRPHRWSLAAIRVPRMDLGAALPSAWSRPAPAR